MSSAALAKGNKKNKQPSPAASASSSSTQAQKQQKNQPKRKEEFKQPDKKKAKQEEKTEEEEQAELEQVIGEVDLVNEELEQLEHELVLQVNKVEAQFQKKRIAIFEKRDEKLSKINGFWRALISNDKTIGACLEDVDKSILQSLDSMSVHDFYDEKRVYKTDGSQQPANGFRVTLHFADGNKYVKAGKITTEIAILSLPPKSKKEVEEKLEKKKNEKEAAKKGKDKKKNGNDDDDDDEDDEDFEDESDAIVISQTPETAFRTSKFAETNPRSFFASWFDNKEDLLELKSLGEILRDIYRNPVPDEDEEEFGEEDEDEDGDE